MTKVLLTLTGPSGVGKSPLEAAVNRLYPGLLAARPVLCHSRKPRVGRGEVHGQDYYFLPPALIRSWVDHPDFLVAQVRSAWQAIDLLQVADLLAQHDLVFAVAYYSFGPSLARLAAERGFVTRSVFLLPVDGDPVAEHTAIVDLMRAKLIRRGTDAPDKIEERAGYAPVEIAAAGAFTHRLVNPAGEDDVDEWGEFGTRGGVPGERSIRCLDDLGPNARWLVETFVEIAKGRLGPGDYECAALARRQGMATDRGELIRQDYESNTWLIRRTVEGLTHEESVLQLPFKANCLNWVLGHILAGRQMALQVLGGAVFWDAGWVERYRGGSAPVTDGKDARTLETLLADVERSQGLLDEALNACSAADLVRMVETGRDAQTVWQVVAGRRWHETYHIGQLGTLRQFIDARREPREPKAQWLYAFEPVRPEMVTDAYTWTERENEIAAEHFAYLKRATQAGMVLLAGRSQDGIGPAIVILEADSEAEARRFMEGDPFVANGLMRARLHPYRAALIRGS